MPTSAEQIRAYRGVALLSYGFRPFFLFGTLWVAFVVAVWLPMLAGRHLAAYCLRSHPMHVHELIYGYVPAVVPRFLLTAVPNWTGRLPATGRPLLGWFALWVSGRAAILFSARIGPGVAAAIDLLFLATLAGVVAREMLVGKNTRNLSRCLPLSPCCSRATSRFTSKRCARMRLVTGTRIGIAAILLLIMLIGGRIIPSFTRNWLAREGPGRLTHVRSL